MMYREALIIFTPGGTYASAIANTVHITMDAPVAALHAPYQLITDDGSVLEFDKGTVVVPLSRIDTLTVDEEPKVY